MGKVLLGVGTDNLFRSLDTTTNAGTDVIFLRPLPHYAKTGTSQITGVISVRDADGNLLTEVMGGEIGAATSVGGFAYGADGVIRLAFAKGQFADAEEAAEYVASFSILFELQETASYGANQYDVKFYSRYDGSKTFDSIIIGDEQLLALMKAKISTADLKNMNPFRIEIFPLIRV